MPVSRTIKKAEDVSYHATRRPAYQKLQSELSTTRTWAQSRFVCGENASHLFTSLFHGRKKRIIRARIGCQAMSNGVGRAADTVSAHLGRPFDRRCVPYAVQEKVGVQNGNLVHRAGSNSGRQLLHLKKQADPPARLSEKSRLMRGLPRETRRCC